MALDPSQLGTEKIIAVDHQDVPQQAIDKLTAHRMAGTLHRAVTIILINKHKEWLFAQRSSVKPLWPLYWDWACSTHQWWPNEDTEMACRRRLPFELGIDADKVYDLHHIGTYEYHAVFSPEWAENEMNHLWLGYYDGELNLNSNEVSAFRWVAVQEWQAELAQSNHRLVPWIKSAGSIVDKITRSA